MKRVAYALPLACLLAAPACKDDPAKAAAADPETPPGDAADGGSAGEDPPEGDAPSDPPREDRGDPPSGPAATSDAAQQGGPERALPVKGRGIAAITKGVIDDMRAAPPDPLGLVPARAILVAQLSMTAMRTQPGFDAAIEGFLIDVEKETGDRLSRMTGCGLGLSVFESAILAMDDDEDAMMIVRGTGIGKVDVWRCLYEAETAAGESLDWKFVAGADGAETIRIDGDSTVEFPDEATLLIYDDAWSESITELRAGSGTPVRKGGLGEVIARTNEEHAIWFAGILPKTSMMSGTPIAQVSDVWGSLDAGLLRYTLHLGGAMPSADDAKSARDEVDKQWTTMKGMASSFGIPSGIVDSVEFGADGASVTMRMEATPTEIKEAWEKMRAAI